MTALRRNPVYKIPQTVYMKQPQGNWGKAKKAEVTWFSKNTLPITLVESYLEKSISRYIKMSSRMSAVQLQKELTREFQRKPHQNTDKKVLSFCGLQSRTVCTRIWHNKYNNRKLLWFSAKAFLCRTLRRSWKMDHVGKFQEPFHEVQNITHARWNILKRHNYK